MKLTYKLTISFLLVGLFAIGLVALFLWLRIAQEFNRYLEEGRQNEFVVAVTNYYQTNQSWAGVDTALRAANLLPSLTASNAPPQPYLLVDTTREILVASAPERIGERVKKGDIERGIAIKVNGQTVGAVIATGQPSLRRPLDQKYVNQIRRAFWIGGLGSAVLALFVGLWLARSLTRPLHNLMAATRAIAQGDLAQRVPIYARDELGELAHAFNQMSADLARATHARRQMTADIAHDLRNPLTVISGYLESLKDGKLEPTAERYQIMQAEVQHLQHLVEDLRTLSLADTGELRIYRQPTAPGDLLDRVATAYQHQAEQSGVALRVTVEPDLPTINVDPERIEQVLGNLVSNALRYTPADGEIHLRANGTAETLTIEVADTGSGIAPEILPAIFERFSRGDPARSGDASGLGLAIVKALVELHGGRVQVASQPGAGSTFSIYLPIQR